MTTLADPAIAPRRKGSTDFIQKIAIGIAILLFALAVFAPWIVPFGPLDQSLLSRLRPPLGFERFATGHYAGTDELGRDVLSRSLYGMRLTLALAFAGALIGLLIGGTLGLVAGLRRGWVEDGIMALVDMQIAIPFTLVALLILSLLGSNLTVLVLVLGIAGWEQYARIVRAEVRRLSALPFIEAAWTAGAGPVYIACRHVLPNLISPLVVQFTLALSNIVILESTLSFLGLGVQPPQPSLGSMVGLGRDYMPTAPWIVLVPAALIVALTFSVQIMGDWLRDRADVRLRDR
ncbi:ABC transporter permease [Sulfitobacter pseudonitzschiae]|uniref:ABC transporter permease n=1 Tax=Pseudosulfitobacter pseudonitzschiae TaxID=1402135 RepID=A0A9Q2RWE5_9RHOB|nr:ABC transporter permease [Pseudosulfitobacter pseudonitzschiae]MBM2293886.1 ABC transporter permease [Pseudosulfitobacter pseudonitzschiae]MBM2298803.1 ABC transporter permease [Pseudosulfitobacter pseudonitzschiae]MBM2303717.1 ABC transporter permease [Pseudosulfitobacter pseudonitzschiae]MBM2313500.1 ABC transporter permease [Pseudosulfitobacter pseudonitzschiae]MBM2318414.1 ABC transporter permease [Pseudosulfitobacter pseudonitzschiae]